MFYDTMKFALALLISMLVMSPTFATGNHPVRGHVNKNGTYVAPHRQTNSNHTQRDNWSAKDNVNPYTGKAGRKDPTKNPAFSQRKNKSNK